MRRDALEFFDRAASARSSADVRSARVIDKATIPHPMNRLPWDRLMAGRIRESPYESDPRAAGISCVRRGPPELYRPPNAYIEFVFHMTRLFFRKCIPE